MLYLISESTRTSVWLYILGFSTSIRLVALVLPFRRLLWLCDWVIYNSEGKRFAFEYRRICDRYGMSLNRNHSAARVELRDQATSLCRCVYVFAHLPSRNVGHCPCTHMHSPRAPVPGNNHRGYLAISRPFRSYFPYPGWDRLLFKNYAIIDRPIVDDRPMQ